MEAGRLLVLGVGLGLTAHAAERNACAYRDRLYWKSVVAAVAIDRFN